MKCTPGNPPGWMLRLQGHSSVLWTKIPGDRVRRTSTWRYLVGRPPGTATVRARLPAPGPSCPGRCIQPESNPNRHRSRHHEQSRACRRAGECPVAGPTLGLAARFGRERVATDHRRLRFSDRARRNPLAPAPKVGRLGPSVCPPIVTIPSLARGLHPFPACSD